MHIVTDSAADLTAAELRAWGIRVAPLSIEFPDGSVDAADVSPDEFYDRLERMAPEVPTTSQPSPGTFREVFDDLPAGPVMSVHISSGLSGTAESARLGAEAAGRDVTVVDTLTLSGAQRFQVLAAARAARLGWDASRILERLGRIRERSEIAFTLETLEYLQRGGRIGRVQGALGSLLRIKPVIAVSKDDGRYDTIGRARSLTRTREQIVERLADAFGPDDGPLWISVLHGRFAAEAEALAALLEERFDVGRLETLRISPVLGVHTGPGVVGAAVVPLRLFEDLGDDAA